MLDSLPLNSSLQQLLLTSGTSYEVGGNTPFLLNDPDGAWLVASGTVEVFTVRVTEGQPIGSRSHFFTARPGDLLFGMDLERVGQGLGFLAVGVVGTQVCKLSLSLLQHLAKEAEFAEEIAALVDNWISGLSFGITKHIYPKPRVDVLAAPDEELTLNDGQKVRARKGTIWLQYLEGKGLFIGMEEIAMPDHRALFPVHQDSWIQNLSTTKLVTSDTRNAIARKEGWEGLELFYEVLFKCEFFNTTLVAVDEYNRLKKKAERNLRAQEESLHQLASIMIGKERGEAEVELDNPLFAACSAVGQKQGIIFQLPPRLKEDQKRRDPLGDITKNSRVRTRPVVLKGEWWKSDNGPLLGYFKEENHPVALLPASPHSYVLYDPSKRATIPVTDEISGDINSSAVCFYRPFPDRMISGRDLLRFAGLGTKKEFLRVGLMAAALSLLALVVPIATGSIFDTVIPEAERGQLVQICLALFVSALATSTFAIVQNITILRIEGKFDPVLNAAVMDRLLSLPVPFFRRYSAGDLAKRVAGMSEIRRLLSGPALLGVLAGIFSLSSFFLLFFYDSKLALIAALITAVIVLFVSFCGWLQLRYQRQVRDLEGKISGIVLQLITGISKLRVAAAESHAFGYWAREFAAQKKLAFKARSASNSLIVFNSVLPILSSVAIFGWISFHPNEALNAGSFLAFNSALTQFLGGAVILSSSMILILSVVPIYERARPILETLPEVDKGKAHPGQLSGELEISHLTFRYETDGPMILKDVSLHVQPGEFIAFVGPSGTGKSTLFRLLLGFEKPERGSILYDGQDLAVLDVPAVRRQIGVVLQQSKVSTGDIFQNIVGTTPLTIDDAWEAARKVGLDEDIKQLPMGMHTVVSEGGSTFSGGQRQRLLIARAIALNPRILLFDEATSALDNRTQAVVSQSLEKLQATRIVIAHRLSTIINADRILVIENGQIVQSGTYSELMSQEGLFQQLAKRQLS